jgi:hypothetical protein
MDEFMRSEPYVPLPSDDEDENWNPHPPRCPDCGSILQNLHPGTDGEWEGWCPEHGERPPVYHDFSELRNDEEEQP